MNFKVWLEAIAAAQSYWITPRGISIPVYTTHIDLILSEPKTFGLTQEEIQETFEKFGEPLGSEGKARKAIMSNLMRDGWIRLRHRTRPDGWTAETGRYDRRAENNLVDWVSDMKMAKSPTVSKYSEINIFSLDGHKISYTFEDFLKQAA